MAMLNKKGAAKKSKNKKKRFPKRYSIKKKSV